MRVKLRERKSLLNQLADLVEDRLHLLISQLRVILLLGAREKRKAAAIIFQNTVIDLEEQR